jgi:lipopolysaccharide export system protein LptC
VSAPSAENRNSNAPERFSYGLNTQYSGAQVSNPRETLHHARRYSAFVRQMKRILPLGALGLALAVLAYAVQPRDGGQLAMTFERMGTIDNDRAMINPRLTGTDDHGMPFIVTAASAVQLGADTERVQLENVRADLVMEDGTPMSVVAATGIVDNREQSMELFGGITMTTADGYTAETEGAHADLRQGIVTGDSQITAEGTMGRLTANGFTFEREAGVLNFIGDVQMLVNGVTP